MSGQDTARGTRTRALRDEREALGVTQQQLASIAGITCRTVERIERGDVRPHAGTLTLLDIALTDLSRRPLTTGSTCWTRPQE
jgi:transcriptional regulator with XRE-family HTH domain